MIVYLVMSRQPENEQIIYININEKKNVFTPKIIFYDNPGEPGSMNTFSNLIEVRLV